MNTLKSRVPGQIPEEHRREFQKARKERQKHGPEISGWIDNCETSLHKASEKEDNVEQGRMHCSDQSKWHQLVPESRLNGR
jgi:hypothetical protein